VQPPQIVLFGMNGQVGHELRRSLAPLGSVAAFNRYQADFTEPDSVLRTLDLIKPRIVVIAAAYTAVDKAVGEPELCEQINSYTPCRISRWAYKNNATVIYYSSDYIFDGAKPHSEAYCEDDAPNPQSVYGSSKLAGEQAVRASGAQYLILRTSWVLGAHGANFAKTMLRLAQERDRLRVVADQWGAPTSASLIADVTAHMLRVHLSGKSDIGTYHLAAAGETNWCDYARFVLARATQSGMSLRAASDAVEAITTAEYPTAAKRPFNSRLSTAKLRSTFGVCLPHWQDGVQNVVDLMIP
jgi:dTDP-4-dehydrorhamnose reductase